MTRCSSTSTPVSFTVHIPASSNVCSTVWPVLSSVPSLSKSQLYPNGSTPPSAFPVNSMIAGASLPLSLAFDWISAVRGVVVGGSSVGGSSAGGVVASSVTLMSTESVASCWSASVTVRVTVYRRGSSNVCSTVWSVLPVLSSPKSQLYANGSTPPSAFPVNSMVAGASLPLSLAFDSISAVRGVVVGGSSAGGCSVGGSSAGGTCGSTCINSSPMSSPTN